MYYNDISWEPPPFMENLMTRMKYKGSKRIAPRLANGQSRVAFGHGLPPEIKEGIRAIAIRENKSMSWVMEEVIIRYFHLPKPEYVPLKKEPNPMESLEKEKK